MLSAYGTLGRKYLRSERSCILGLPDRINRSMTFFALYLQKGLDAPVSQHRNIGLDARRTFELIALDSVYFLHRINRGPRFTRQQFNFRFFRSG